MNSRTAPSGLIKASLRFLDHSAPMKLSAATFQGRSVVLHVEEGRV